MTVLGLALAGAVAGSSERPAGGAEIASAAPYSDSAATGSIGLCDQSGKQITSGSTDTTPFAWRAVSTQPAPSPYDNGGRTATLYAFQPRQGLAPGEWSGQQLTSSSRYSNPANPMAAATAGDESLADFLGDFPTKWDGFVQLRIYLATANEPAETLHYPSLNIQVTGTTWHAIGGSPVNCESGTSVSLESIVLPPSSITAGTGASTGTPAPTGSASGAGARASGSSGSTARSKNAGSGSNPASTGPSVRHLSAAAAASRTRAAGGDSTALIAGLVAGGLVLLASGSVLIVRRRRLASIAAGSGTLPDPNRKGHGA